jgi:peptidoglycan/xylan/chitin deacetylase (PgdA/CDA1 family)
MKKNRKSYIIIYLSIILLVFILFLILYVGINKKNYLNKELKRDNLIINYPYFNKSFDKTIYNYVKTNDFKDNNRVDYEVKLIDNDYNILFKIYKNDLITDYYTLFFDNRGKQIDLKDIIDLNYLKSKLNLYILNKTLNLSDNELNKATINYLFEKNRTSFYLTNYDDNKDIAFIPINNNEIKEKTRIKLDINSNYKMLKTITTSTTTTIPVPKKFIAFTFDDGPSDYTIDLLNILDSYHAKATFFEVGYNIKNRSNVTLEIYKRGFEIGNHTIDHSNLVKFNATTIQSKINDNNALYNSITGSNMNLVRPPYGNLNALVKANVNAPLILWSVDTEDWKSRDTDKIVAEVLNNVKEGDIVLFHDIYKTSVEAIAKVLPILYEQNYQVVSVSELFKENNIQLVNGEVYRKAK